MHLALIKCAASLLFVISGRSGARIKSAVRLQILSFLGLQSIAFLPHSIPYSASSFLKSPLTIAALTGPENDARWWESHNHQSHCSCFYCVCVCIFILYLCMWSRCALLLLFPECVANWFSVPVCASVWVCGVMWQVSNLSWIHIDYALSQQPPHTYTYTMVQQVGSGCQSGFLRV